MISPWYGEFLVNPIALELKGNFCSHGCPYCFANLNRPHRALDLEKTLNQLAKMQIHENLHSILLREKYPICISNHNDPFSISNCGTAVHLMKILTDFEIPIFLQTRGGVETAIAETLGFLKPSIWYVSITHSNDVSRQQVEPQAPSIEQRIELIKELVRFGHGVYVGFNPLVPDWMPEIEELISKIKEAGAFGVVVECLHLSAKQKKAMPRHHQLQIGDHLLQETSKRNRDSHYQFFDLTRKLIIEAGLTVWSNHQFNHSNYMDLFHQYYPKHFPTEQCFVNHLIEENITIFSGKDWIDFHLEKLPSGLTGWHRQYIYSSNLAVSIPYRVPPQMNYHILLRLMLQSYKFFGNPSHNAGISQFVDNNLEPILTRDNYPIYSFSNEHIPSFFMIGNREILLDSLYA